MPSSQAEVQAEVLSEAFNVNLEELVTKDFLVRQLAEERAATDKRFEQVNVKFAEVNVSFRTLYWINGLIILVTVVPALQRMISF